MTLPAFSGIEPPARQEVESTDELARVVGENLRRLRTRRGLSLERLAQASGVSRAMLGQIELGRSAPTIGVLWKIARSLEVPLTAFTTVQGVSDVILIRADHSRILSSPDGKILSRALFPREDGRRVEFHELRIKAGGVEETPRLPDGSVKNLVVLDGVIELAVGARSLKAATGDAIQFSANEAHHIKNLSLEDARLYLVVSLGEGR